MQYENVDNPKDVLVNTIKKNQDWFEEIEAKLVIANQKGSSILYRGIFDFHHKTDTPVKEVTYDYGKAILAIRKLSVEEFFNIIN